MTAQPNRRVEATQAQPAIMIPGIAEDGHLFPVEKLDAHRRAIFHLAISVFVFDGEALRHFVELASWVVVNDYEGKMLSQRTGWSLAEISQRVRGLVVTLAADGCEVWTDGVREHVPGVVPTEVVEPTGCGDAWRGALLFGLEKEWPLAQCAALGN
eukprot:gene44552-59445_t